MGHTHRAELSRTAGGGTYLNPGAWFEGLRYAIATEDGAELRQFTPAAPLPPGPAGPR
jgi:UDP-2,3-diacylglucosamine pyrophosphatase LpxH